MTTIDNSGNIHACDGRFAGHVKGSNQGLSASLADDERPSSLADALAQEWTITDDARWERMFHGTRARGGQRAEVDAVSEALAEAEGLHVLVVREEFAGRSHDRIIVGDPNTGRVLSSRVVSAAEFATPGRTGKARAEALAEKLRREARIAEWPRTTPGVSAVDPGRRSFCAGCGVEFGQGGAPQVRYCDACTVEPPPRSGQAVMVAIRSGGGGAIASYDVACPRCRNHRLVELLADERPPRAVGVCADCRLRHSSG